MANTYGNPLTIKKIKLPFKNYINHINLHKSEKNIKE